MKKYLCFFISYLLVIISCNKTSSSSSDVNVNIIVAKWQYNAIKTNGIVANLSTCSKTSYVLFYTNGTFERKHYSLMSNSTCVIDGDEKGTYTYSSSTNKIILKFTDPVEGAQVETWNNVKITNSSLDFTWDENNDGKDEHAVTYIK